MPSLCSALNRNANSQNSKAPKFPPPERSVCESAALWDSFLLHPILPGSRLRNCASPLQERNPFLLGSRVHEAALRNSKTWAYFLSSS